MYDENPQEENLQILEFDDVDEAIEFANEIWEGSDDYSGAMRATDAELDENDESKVWLFANGLCDICGGEQNYFIPACTYEDEIKGIECIECENMSVYPRELEDGLEEESENDV